MFWLWRLCFVQKWCNIFEYHFQVVLSNDFTWNTFGDVIFSTVFNILYLHSWIRSKYANVISNKCFASYFPLEVCYSLLRFKVRAQSYNRCSFLFIARSSSSCPPLCWGLILGFVIVLLLGAGIAAVFLKKKGRWSEYLLLFCTESMRCDNLESERVQCILKLC